MKQVVFNTPLQDVKYFNNVKKLLDSKKSLHGPGENILKIKKELKSQFGLKNLYRSVTRHSHEPLFGPDVLFDIMD